MVGRLALLSKKLPGYGTKRIFATGSSTSDGASRHCFAIDFRCANWAQLHPETQELKALGAPPFVPFRKGRDSTTPSLVGF